MKRGVYVTGTDTGIGKTHVSVALLHALQAHGLRAVGMKPVASGCVETREGWRNDDALALQAASWEHPAYARVNPFALPLATAPEIAAAVARVEVTLAPMLASFEQLAADARYVVVEGVGGWAAPLSPKLDQADLVRALAIPVVLVIGLKLGCISHARLSLDALHASRVDVRGWIANTIDPAFEHRDATLAILHRCLAPTPCLGRVPHGATNTAMPAFDLGPLLGPAPLSTRSCGSGGVVAAS